MYVTHDQTEAMTMGDRVAVLQGGVLQQYGTPRSLYDRPANVFVATFIGSPAMNLYEAGLEVGPAALVLGSQRLSCPRPSAARVAAYRGRKILVGIRPEDLTVSGGAGSALVADVRFVEVLGSEQHVYFSIDATPAGGAVARRPSADESAEAGILLGSAPNGAARAGSSRSRSSPAGGSPSPWIRRGCTSSTLTPARRLPGSPGLIFPTRRRPVLRASAARREASEYRYRGRPRRRNRRRSVRPDASSRGNLRR